MARKLKRSTVNPYGTPDQQDRARGAYPRITEDDPRWDPKTQGNKRGKKRAAKPDPPGPSTGEYRRVRQQWT